MEGTVLGCLLLSRQYTIELYIDFVGSPQRAEISCGTGLFLTFFYHPERFLLSKLVHVNENSTPKRDETRHAGSTYSKVLRLSY